MEKLLLSVILVVLLICFAWVLGALEQEKEVRVIRTLRPLRRRVRIPILVIRAPPLPREEEFQVPAPENYFEAQERHGNDPQNVHDSSVVASLRGKYERLLELQDQEKAQELGLTREEFEEVQTLASLQEIEQLSLERFQGEPEKQAKLRTFLQEVRKGGTLSSLVPPGETPPKEERVLSLVWERIHHPSNLSRVRELEDLLLAQILDGVEEGGGEVFDLLFGLPPLVPAEGEVQGYSTVCIGGRVARLLSVFTLLDSDPVLQEPERDRHELSNLAYHNAHALLEKLLTNWNSSLSRPMRELYETLPEELNEEEREEVTRFTEHCKQEIEKELLEKYTGVMKKDQLRETIEKAKAGV